jgi:cbb3-type cytochrome oxidase subunit 3
MGSHWEMIREKLHNFDVAVAALIVIGIVWYVWRHIKHARQAPPAT